MLASKSLKLLVKPSNTKLFQHPIYRSIKDTRQLQLFMENHAFAVWDFMTLLKALQINLTCVQIPWTPPKDSRISYFINSIVLGEESDDMATSDYKQALSHYNLYLKAMDEVGANSSAIKHLVNSIQNGTYWYNALQETRLKYPRIPVNTFEFVEFTMNVVQKKDPVDIAAAFLYGREDPIPQMFQNLLTQLGFENINCPNLKKYLERHIEVDSDDHGPMGGMVIDLLCGNDSTKLESAQKTALEAINMRIKLWDGIYNILPSEGMRKIGKRESVLSQ